MNNNWRENGPVVVGGVGGSGTRVVAEILRQLGFYMGNDLNPSNDYLAYTLLFKRPKWYQQNYDNVKQIDTGLNLLEKIILAKGVITLNEYWFGWVATRNMAKWGHNTSGDGSGDWYRERVKKMFAAHYEKERNCIGWGWKEPNTHLMLTHLNRKFPHLKYIHVIRHGLDMAFSANQQQLFNWGALFGVDTPESTDIQAISRASLQYWVKANQTVVEKGKALGEQQFLLLNFDLLCEKPASEIQRLVNFLKVEPSQASLEKVSALPQKPQSSGRYQQHDLNQFNPDDLNALSNYGFMI